MSTIHHTIRRLVSRKYRSQLQLQYEVEYFLASLPQCNGVVLVADPSYGEGEYSCEITVPAGYLLAWSREYAQKSITQSVRDEAVRQGLPIWLAQARFDNREVTRLPREAFRALSAEIASWVRNGVARVECRDCGKAVSDIRMTEFDKAQAGNKYYWWTDVWTCPEGHRLMQQNQEMRIYRAPPPVE